MKTTMDSDGTILPRIKLWLCSEDNEGIFGDGKYRLLESIRDTGCLSTAAKALGMSYRKAWGDIAKAEERLGVKLVDRRRGGQDGGHTSLTEAGEKVMCAYAEFRDHVEQQVNETFEKHLPTFLNISAEKPVQ